MKTTIPAPGYTAEQVLALLQSPQMQRADLYTIVPVVGTIAGVPLFFTSFDMPVEFYSPISPNPLVSFAARGLLIDRKKASWKNDLSTDSYDVHIAADNGYLIPGTTSTLQNAIRIGLFDGATVIVQRVFIPANSGSPLGGVLIFAGRWADVSPMTDQGADITINSWVEVLDVQCPRNLYDLSCIHALYDAGCTISKTAFTTSHVGSSPCQVEAYVFVDDEDTIESSESFYSNIITSVPYTSGMLTFTSGENEALTRQVKFYDSTGSTGLITVIPAFPSTPQIGDTFTITYGCDKTLSTCNSVFSNLSNFRGFPFIPPITEGL